MPSAATYKLVYFDIRGLAEPIRWMFAIAGENFVDERIPLDQWEREKVRFTKHVGQLPLLYIGDELLTQVHACIRYVARRCGFNGSNEREEARADEATELIYDLRLCCVAYKDSFSSATPDIVRHTVFRDFCKEQSIVKKARMRKHLVEDYFPKYFGKFAELLEEAGGQWIAGPKLTYADLCLANFLDVAETMVNPDVLNGFPTLQQLKKDVFAIPEIQKYIEASLNRTSMVGG